MKKLLIAFLILIFLGGLTYFSYQVLKSEIVKRLEKGLHAKISYKSFEIYPFKGLRTSDFKAGNFFGAESITVFFSIKGFLSGRIDSVYAKNAY